MSVVQGNVCRAWHTRRGWGDIAVGHRSCQCCWHSFVQRLMRLTFVKPADCLLRSAQLLSRVGIASRACLAIFNSLLGLTRPQDSKAPLQLAAQSTDWLAALCLASRAVSSLLAERCRCVEADEPCPVALLGWIFSVRAKRFDLCGVNSEAAQLWYRLVV